MTAAWRSGMTVLIVILSLALSLAAAVAQPSDADIQAIYKRYNERYSAGAMDAALVEGRKLEAALQARYGSNDPNYTPALIAMANVYLQQSKYDEAEKLLRRAVTIFERHPGNDLGLAGTLNALGTACESQNKHAEAEALYTRALAIFERTSDADPSTVAATLLNLAITYRRQEKSTKAEPLLERALAIAEQLLGSDHLKVAEILQVLAVTYGEQRKFSEAANALNRALAIRVKAHGPDHPEVAATLDALAGVYYWQGEFSNAVELSQRALAIKERALGANSPELGTTLQDLATMYMAQGKYDEAAGLFERALAILERAPATQRAKLAQALSNLANLYVEQGKYDPAELLFRRALAIYESADSAMPRELSGTLSGLAGVYRSQRRYSEAEDLHRRALAIQEKFLSADDPLLAENLNKWGVLADIQGKLADADALYKRALAIREKAYGSNNPDVVETLTNLAQLSIRREDISSALAWARKATAATLAHHVAEIAAARQPGQTVDPVARRAFESHLAGIVAAARQGLKPIAALGGEGFEIAQWAHQSSAATAVQQMAARAGSGSGANAALVRESQDLAESWRDKNKMLINALSNLEGQGGQEGIEALRHEITEIEGRLRALDERLEREFPYYSTLTNPKPLRVAEVQKLLAANEALVFFLASQNGTYIFALTQDDFTWNVHPLNAADLTEAVATFRRGLAGDPVSHINNEISPEQARTLFDLDFAHALYRALLEPVEALIKDKTHLMIVPTAALTALPFHLLVTEKPAAAVPTRLAGYRDAAWLLKRQAITVLPSAASLKMLRGFPHRDEAPQPMIGFGDPIFDPNEQEDDAAAGVIPGNGENTRGVAQFFRGGSVVDCRAAVDHVHGSMRIFAP